MLNVFSIGIILILIGYIIGGWKNGVVKETTSLIGMIIVFFLSYYLKGIVGNFLCSVLPFFEFDGLVSLNILIYQAIAFFLLYSIFMGLYSFLLKISNGLQKIVNATIILIIPSKILGAIIGLISGWITMFIILLVLLIPLKDFDQFKDSTMNNIILFHTPVLSDTVKPLTKGALEIYDVSSKIAKKKIDTNEANLKSIDIMLKYKLVDKDTIENLIENNKLDKIKNLDSILNNY
ncbi:MAG: CvpA family protein [Bacilli bacterium]|nr:CvpA family protein [Bacilli bacterium]